MLRRVKVIAIATKTAEEVRKTMKSPEYGHPAVASVATGHGPCRHCLQPFVVGEERRILFTMNSFAGMDAVPQPGPVFVHERVCTRYAEGAGYPKALLPFGAVLDGYDARQLPVRREVIFNGSQESQLARMFEDEAVCYVMVRDGKAGCYDFRVERA